jgi:pimeloyl-ACP methyl ester carboxylesterase
MSSNHAILPPTRVALFREALGVLEFVRRRRAGQTWQSDHRGDGRPVLVIPGFLASDSSTTCLRAALDGAGYDAHGWGLGVNRGARADLLERLGEQVEAFGEPVALVGWSLGGVYAREVAKLLPDAVERVITLGSPFSGDPRANNAWRLYEWVNGHRVDDLPFAVDRSAKPPVKTIALWSKDDGIIAPAAARGLPGEADHRMMVDCRHMGFTSSPAAIEGVFRALEM